MIIDSHQHFWKYNAADYGWISDEMPQLKQDLLPEHLAVIYAREGIDACVAVQARQSEAETNFLLDLAGKHDLVRGVVGWIDLRADNLEERLDYYATFPKLKGFRHIVQDEPDPDFMLRKDFQRGLEILAQYHFSYDILVFPQQMPAAIQTVEKFPDLPFVLDHLAKPFIKKREKEPWLKHMLQLADFPHVYAKISGLVTEADWQGWTYEDFVPYLATAFEAFGVERLMYGSDWPVCLLAASYGEVKGILDRFMESYSNEDKSRVYYKNAMNFYHL